MYLTTNCLICGLQGHQLSPPLGDAADINCTRCGSYKISEPAAQAMADVPSEARPVMAEWVRSQNSLGDKPEITVDTIPLLRALPRLEFMERAQRLLVYLAKKTDRLGGAIIILAPEVQARLQTFDDNEICYIASFLEESGWVKFYPADGAACLTARGIIRADELRRTQVASMQGFVAMWFDAGLQSAWTDGFVPAISAAGYKPQRIDKTEHVNKICDEIVAEIRRSRFVVADFTGHRGGVYFEAGFAMGLDLPVVWTCCKDDMKNLHFDIRQYNCIDWETPADLAARLQARISAVLGDGPLKRT